MVGNSNTPPPIDWSDVLQTHHSYGDAPIPAGLYFPAPTTLIPRTGTVLGTVVGPAPTGTPPPPSPADSLATQLDCLPSHIRFTAGRVDGLRQALQALLTWPVEGREVLTTRHEPPAVLSALREWQGPLSYTLRFVSWPFAAPRPAAEPAAMSTQSSFPSMAPASSRQPLTLTSAMVAAVGPRTALVVFSQSYPRLVVELPLIVAYPSPQDHYNKDENLPRQINAKPAAEGGPAGLRRIPVIVDLTDSVGWVQMVKLQAAPAPVDPRLPPPRARSAKAQAEEAAALKASRAEAYLCAGDHLVGSPDVGFLVQPTEIAAAQAAVSTTSSAGPPLASSQRLVDAFVKTCARAGHISVPHVVGQMHSLLRCLVDHALEPLYCPLPRPDKVKQNWVPQMPDILGPCYRHSLIMPVNREHHRWLVLSFRGVDADSLVQALAHPSADVKPVHSWYGTEPLEPVLACVVPRSHPIFRVHWRHAEVGDSVVCFSPPWTEEPSQSTTWPHEDDGTPPPQRAVRVASTVAAVYVHMLRRAHPQWKTTMPTLPDPHYNSLVDAGTALAVVEHSAEEQDSEVGPSSQLRSVNLLAGSQVS